jgi:hypothetical protein
MSEQVDWGAEYWKLKRDYEELVTAGRRVIALFMGGAGSAAAFQHWGLGKQPEETQPLSPGRVAGEAVRPPQATGSRAPAAAPGGPEGEGVEPPPPPKKKAAWSPRGQRAS